MRVRIVKFSDGDDPMYFIDGQRDENIQHHDDLLQRLVGHQLDAINTVWVEPSDWDDPEPWESMEFLGTEQELDAHLASFPILTGQGG